MVSDLAPKTCLSFACFFLFFFHVNCSRFSQTGTSIYIKWMREWVRLMKEKIKQDIALPAGSPPPGMQHSEANFVLKKKKNPTEAAARGQLGSWCHIGEIWHWRFKAFWRTSSDLITRCSHFNPKAVLFLILPNLIALSCNMQKIYFPNSSNSYKSLFSSFFILRAY